MLTCYPRYASCTDEQRVAYGQAPMGARDQTVNEHFEVATPHPFDVFDAPAVVHDNRFNFFG